MKIMLSFLLLVFACSDTNANESDATQASNREAILSSIVSYVEAFNSHDAEAMAAHWSKDGCWINPESGEQVRGPEAIARELAAQLNEDGGSGSQLSVHVNSLQFVADNVAIEDGIATNDDGNGNRSTSNYSVVHVLENGHWKIASIRETVTEMEPVIGEAPERLSSLSWLIGEWIDDAADATVESSFSWTKNKTFITRTFKVAIPGEIDLEGTQVIGWDPVEGVIRSWMFDSDGSFGQGVWTETADGWTILSNQTLAGGSQATSLNRIRRVSATTFSWEANQRNVDGNAVPDVPKTLVHRR